MLPPFFLDIYTLFHTLGFSGEIFFFPWPRKWALRPLKSYYTNSFMLNLYNICLYLTSISRFKLPPLHLHSHPHLSQWCPVVKSLQPWHSPVWGWQYSLWPLHWHGRQWGKPQKPGRQCEHWRPVAPGTHSQWPVASWHKGLTEPRGSQLQAVGVKGLGLKKTFKLKMNALASNFSCTHVCSRRGRTGR